MKTKAAAHTPDVDRVIEQVKNGDVFSGDWHTLRLIEQERDALRRHNLRLVALLTSMNHMVGDEHGGYCICVRSDGSAPDRQHASHCADARALLASIQGKSWKSK